MKVIFDVNTFGFTQRAVNYLRNALAESINHHIVVIEVTTTGGIRCGFLIIDNDADEVVWSGDGFSVHGQREDRHLSTENSLAPNA